MVITLLGRFKDEIGESYHLIPIMASTPRVLHPRKWVGRVLEEYQKIGIQRGCMYRNADGTWLKIKKLNQNLTKTRIDKHQKTRYNYSKKWCGWRVWCSRSFWRWGTSEATNKGAPDTVIELNGRWRKSNQGGARKLNATIHEHNIDIRLVLDQLQEFSNYT
jgi:hypothetical protein